MRVWIVVALLVWGCAPEHAPPPSAELIRALPKTGRDHHRMAPLLDGPCESDDDCVVRGPSDCCSPYELMCEGQTSAWTRAGWEQRERICEKRRCDEEGMLGCHQLDEPPEAVCRSGRCVIPRRSRGRFVDPGFRR